MYTVLKGFLDFQDDLYEYETGDPYPRTGLTVSDDRIAELSGKGNLQHAPLIKEVKTAVKKPTRGKRVKPED